MKNKLLLALTVVATVLIFAVVLFRSKPKTPDSSSAQQAQDTERTIDVVALNSKFEPSDFQLKHFEIINLNITAKDADYEFVLKELGIDAKLPKGATTTVEVAGLGVGTYQYTCGKACSGTVVVNPQSDEEGD